MSVRAILLSLLSGLVAAATTTPASAQTRTVIDAEGSAVALPQAVRRIAALSEIDLDSCLALGIKPVATVNGRGQKSHPHYLQSQGVSDVPVVGDLGRPNLEALIRLKPDLILTAPTRPEILALMRRIAPTAVTYRNSDPWKLVFDRVATILGREAAAAEFLARYEQELRAARGRLPSLQGKTVSIVRWNPNGPAFMQRDAFASLVLRDLGLDRPPAQQVEGQKHSMPISLEALHMIDADWLFIGTLEASGESATAMREVADNPAFQRLTAVKSKRHHPVDGSKWTSVGGPLAALSIVKETADAIAGAQKPKSL